MENIPLPPVPVITRWRDIDNRCFILRRIFYKIPKDRSAVSESTFISTHLLSLVEIIKKLETANMLLFEMNELEEKINIIPGLEGITLKTK
ncbi:DUF659 domain-containing protein, partial [Aphis craccivora]